MLRGLSLGRSHIPRAVAYTYTILTPPATSALTLAEVKDYLRITSTADDALIQLLIDSATAFAEKFTKRDFITRTWTTFRDDFRDITIELRRSPLQTVDRFEYFVNNVLTPVDNSTYYNTLETDYSRIALVDDACWPTDIDCRIQAIQIDFTTGYGNSSSDIPADLRNALLAHIISLYENRGDCIDCGAVSNKGIESALPDQTAAIYQQYRIHEYKVGIR